jgi:hypothetical protein
MWSKSVQEHEQHAMVHSAQAGIWVMCWKCDEIDKVILHYRTLSARVTDTLTLEGLQQLTNKLEAEKMALHSELKKEDSLD